MNQFNSYTLEEANALNLTYDLYNLGAVGDLTATSIAEFYDRVDDILKAQELGLVGRYGPNTRDNFIYVTKKGLIEIGKD
ncbi:MAG: hypothetical protein PHH06_05420 [Candidatus Gracilibacteria bacterium]|nr:hypothetical protein [Candidatus Gracilibacteria bacterium]